MTALRRTLAALAATAALTGCTSTTATPDPAPAPADPQASNSGSSAGGTTLPALATDGDGDRTLVGCPNSIGWIGYTDTTLTDLGVVATTSPTTVQRWRPTGAKGANTRTEYRLALSTDGTTAAVTSVETVRGSATEPDRYVSVVQVFDIATRTQTTKVEIPGITLPYTSCYDDLLVLTPRRAYPVPAKHHQAHVVDTTTGQVLTSVRLRPDEDNEDHVGAVVANTLVVHRFNDRTDTFATEGVALDTGKRRWVRKAPRGADFAFPVTAADPRFGYVIGTPSGRTVVLDAATGKPVASVPAPRSPISAAAVIDPFTGNAYLTDGSNLAAVSLVTGAAQPLSWGRKLHRVGFDLHAALDNHLVATTKGELRSLAAATGADEGALDSLVTVGGLNWAGTTDDGALTTALLYNGPMNPRVRIDADTHLTGN